MCTYGNHEADYKYRYDYVTLSFHQPNYDVGLNRKFSFNIGSAHIINFDPEPDIYGEATE
jgi:hypothetical protein